MIFSFGGHSNNNSYNEFRNCNGIIKTPVFYQRFFTYNKLDMFIQLHKCQDNLCALRNHTLKYQATLFCRQIFFLCPSPIKIVVTPLNVMLGFISFPKSPIRASLAVSYVQQIKIKFNQKLLQPRFRRKYIFRK